MVTARKASIGVSRCSGPITCAAARRRVTALQIRNRMFGGTTGASLCKAEPHPPPPRRPRRVDAEGPLAAQHRRHVPVAPVEAVRGAERRDDPERLHPVQLVLARRLGVHHHRPAIDPTWPRRAAAPRARPPRSSARSPRRRSRARARARRARSSPPRSRSTSSSENSGAPAYDGGLALRRHQVRLGQPGASSPAASRRGRSSRRRRARRPRSRCR